MARTTEVVLDGFMFPEGPRWHNGRLVFSDMHGHRVVSLDVDRAQAETVCEMPAQPSGLGWLPDGRMLVVSMTDRRVLRQEADGTLVEHADLSSLAPWWCNDMVVDAQGRAFVGNFGFDMYGGGTPCKTNVVRVEPDGSAVSAADDLGFPNGMVITPDGATLIVGESFGALTAFSIADDGTLADRREFARPEGAVPDGICLDAEGAVWIACPMSNRCLRIAEGGAVLDEVTTGRGTFACMLGGDDRTTLFVCTADDHAPDAARAKPTGRIEAVRVDVPGAGYP
jgi:sugar lactone lactonase YvrE